MSLGVAFSSLRVRAPDPRSDAPGVCARVAASITSFVIAPPAFPCLREIFVEETRIPRELGKEPPCFEAPRRVAVSAREEQFEREFGEGHVDRGPENGGAAEER